MQFDLIQIRCMIRRNNNKDFGIKGHYHEKLLEVTI